MGRSKVKVKETNNNIELSKLDGLTGSADAMVNSGRKPRTLILKNLEDLSTDSDMTEKEDFVKDMESERKIPDNLSFYDSFKNPTEEQNYGEQSIQNSAHYNNIRSPWSQTPISAQSFLSEDDDDYLFRPTSSISSARSSISWAEDAVEAEFTEQLAALWEDIERVCGGEEKPAQMSMSVYEECLQWRRAFPRQTLTMPSRFTSLVKSGDGDSTPTPTNDNFNSLIQDIQESSFSAIQTPDQHRPFSEEGTEEECLTPNPTTSSQYVTSWLSDCQQAKFQFPTSYAVKENQLPDPVSARLPSTTANNDIDAPGSSNYFIRPIARKPNRVIQEEVDWTDEEDEERDEEGSRSLSWAQTNTICKVQRPVSSYAKGHMMTPMRTTEKPEPVVPQKYYLSPTAKPAHFSFHNNTIRNPTQNRIPSSLPPGRTAPNLISSPPFSNLGRAHETMSSGYRRGPKNYMEKQKSKATIASSSLQNPNQGSNSVQLPSISPYWSRHSNSNSSPALVQEDPNSQGESISNGDFSTEEYFERNPSVRKRPTNLTFAGDKLPTTERGDGLIERPVKPFIFWLFDRVSPN